MSARMNSAARPPIMIDGALVAPEMMDGMTEASATRRPAHATHAKLAVDDSIGVASHSRRAYRMPEAERARAHEVDEVLLALGLWTGDELGFANPVESFLAHELARGFRGSQSRLEIAVRAEQVPFDRRWNAPIRARQAHLSAAGGLNQRR